jgi:FkbM family methyltransferase
MLHIADVPLINHFGTYLSNLYGLEERQDAATYVRSTASVLEIGARFGSVSCTVNQILNDKTRHVAFEPDESVWQALETNRDVTNSKFHIVKGTLSKKPCNLTFLGAGLLGGTKRYREESRLDMLNRYHITYDDFKNTYFIPDTLIMNCEGAFHQILNEFTEILNDIHTIIIKWDGDDEESVYQWRNYFLVKGFVENKKGFYSVYQKIQK